MSDLFNFQNLKIITVTACGHLQVLKCFGIGFTRIFLNGFLELDEIAITYWTIITHIRLLRYKL